MKRVSFLSVVFGVLAASPAGAITIDGNLSDWGITPFNDWHIDLQGEHAQHTKYATGVEHDRYHPAPATAWAGNPAWDIEFGGAVATEEGLFFLLITSKDQTSGFGDLGISIGSSLQEQGPQRYTHGVDLTDFAADGKVHNRPLYQVSEWDIEHGGSYPDHPFGIIDGAVLGSIQVVQADLGRIEPGELNAPGGGQTYVLEGYLPFSLLGFSTLLPGTLIEFHHAKVSCMRDWIAVQTAVSPVPEPATMALMASGLLLGAGLRTRRRCP